MVAARHQSSAPEKIEVFIDDQPVMVEPGTTVLQVGVGTVVIDSCLYLRVVQYSTLLLVIIGFFYILSNNPEGKAMPIGM